jgi:hypothetical protein
VFSYIAAFRAKHPVEATISGVTLHNRISRMLLFPGKLMIGAARIIHVVKSELYF